MVTTPISSHALKNGLTLRFLDESKKIAGDRWYVCVQVSIKIPVEKKWFADYPMDDAQFNQITRVLGNEVVFRQKKERNFISDEVKTQVVNEIRESTMETGLTYFGSDAFAAKFILKAYADRRKPHLY